MVEFIMDPIYCPVVYTCEGVAKKNLLFGEEPIECSDLTLDLEFNGDSTDGKLTFAPTIAEYSGYKYPPGEYEITIRGMATLALDFGYEETIVTMVLLDPCDLNPTNSEAVLEDQSYILTQNGYVY